MSFRSNFLFILVNLTPQDYGASVSVVDGQSHLASVWDVKEVVGIAE